jgi:hypothetical protein
VGREGSTVERSDTTADVRTNSGRQGNGQEARPVNGAFDGDDRSDGGIRIRGITAVA